MPLGSSGKHYNNPHVMRAHGDMPKEAAEPVHEAKPQPGMEREGGDTKHEVVKRSDGGYHSIHTHPDGTKEPATEHPSYEHAMHHMADKMGESMDPQPEQDMDSSDSGSDGGDCAVSSLYEK